MIRTAMEKMKTIYEQNPSLGDAQQVAQRLAENTEKIGAIKSEIEEFKVFCTVIEMGASLPNIFILSWQLVSFVIQALASL